MTGLRRPRPLRPGDVIAILTPATTVRPDFIDGAERVLTEMGYRVRVMPHAKGPAAGSFAAPLGERLDDFITAYRDPEVRAILCARGGYGCVHLLPDIDAAMLAADPKWVIGFSDISAFHAMMYRAGVMSVHSSMAKMFAEQGADYPNVARLMAILTGGDEGETAAPLSPYNRCGSARGVLRGGNLAVLNGLADTPYDLLHVAENEDVILFLEDISEAIYAVERMLTRLILGGNIQRLKGLVIGQFTEYRPDKNHQTMEEMIDRLLRRHDIRIPVIFDFPTGHVDDNRPLVEGAEYEMIVTSEEAKLRRI